jgi:hypothetical protein
MLNLNEKNIGVERLAREAVNDKDIFQELKDGVRSKDNTIRQNSFKAMQIIADEDPDFLYVQWDYFQEMVHSPNNYHKYIAIYILASLTSVDKDNKFEVIFDEYYGILAGAKAMTASHVALNSSVIAHNKPDLRSRIVGILISIDEIHQGKQKELIKAYAIESLGKIYSEAEDKELIENYVKSQRDSKSPKTRNMAQCFLERC